MSERIIENVSTKINNIIDKCLKHQMSVEEAKNKIINTLKIIVTEYGKIIKDEYMNEIHIILSKIIFSENNEMVVDELNKINEIMRKIITEFTDITQNINWYDEVKRRIV